jgi:peptidyl-prolyl cis-trans isomerase A (cyclophilin A)
VTSRSRAAWRAAAVLALGLGLGVASAAAAQDVAAGGGKPMVTLTTSLGVIELELDAGKAPITVQNFLSYVDAGHFDGTIFHRVIPNFMIQGGGFGTDSKQKATRAAIKNEADNGLANARGTVAMARTNVVDSATAQFFINLKDNDFLNHAGPGAKFGYAVFGRVTKGMDVVDKIAAVPAQRGPLSEGQPLTQVVIQSAKRKQ